MKKAKKIVIPVILVLCLCAVCALLFVNYREARKYQPPINGISWGMTSDEMIKKLALSQDDVTKGKEGNSIVSYENATIFNQEATVKLYFDNQSRINLYCMSIDFPKLTEDELINQLKPLYGTGFGKTTYTWTDGKVKDLPQKIQDRIKYVKIDLSSKQNGPSAFSEEGLWEMYQSSGLVQAELRGTSLWYFGDCMAVSAIASDDKKYNAWIEYLENLYKNHPAQDSPNNSKLPVE